MIGREVINWYMLIRYQRKIVLGFETDWSTLASLHAIASGVFPVFSGLRSKKFKREIYTPWFKTNINYSGKKLQTTEVRKQELCMLFVNQS